MPVNEAGANIDVDMTSIDDLWISLRAELDHKTVAVSELLSLDVDSILELGRATGENIDLFAGDVRLGSGEIVIVDSALAVRLADLGDGLAENDNPAERN